MHKPRNEQHENAKVETMYLNTYSDIIQDVHASIRSLVEKDDRATFQHIIFRLKEFMYSRDIKK